MATDARDSGLIKLNSNGQWVRWAPPIGERAGIVERADVLLDKRSAEAHDEICGITRDELGNIIKVEKQTWA